MMKTTIKKLDKSEVEIIGILELAEFEKFEGKALERIGERLELPGFRKGKAPVEIVKGNVQEMELLEEMAELALSENYVKILEENKIDAIGRPQIAITKIGKGSDLEFKIVTAILPEIKLPDYKKIAKSEIDKGDYVKEITVDEKDVEKTILELRKMRAEQKKHDTNTRMETNDTNKENHEGHENMTEEEHAKAHEAKSSETGSPDASKEAFREIPESEYPAFDDEFAKSFGKFENADAFREKIRSNMKMEKEVIQKDKLRLSIV
jgi:trigger factor